MDILRERRELKALLGSMPRSPRQVNGLFEADTEILRLPGGYLVTSTDSIGEEITQGLYRSPFLWGWLTVMNSVSDLAASGAEGLGLLISTQWAFKAQPRVQREFMNGVRAALRSASLPLLGGDSGSAKDHVFTSTVIGRSKRRPLTRLGVRPGDRVFLLGRKRLGAGPALAFRHLAGARESVFPEALFRPRPDWRTMHRTRSLLSSAIDTSDGLAVGLAILGTLNNVAFRLQWNDKTLLPAAAKACEHLDLPLPLLWMSDLGDLQALVTARPAKARELRRQPDFIEIGEAVPPSEGHSLAAGSRTMEFPAHWVTNGGRDLAAIRRLTERQRKHFRGFYSTI